MANYYSADYILPVSGPPIKNGTVAVNRLGKITGVYEENDEALSDKPVQKMEGVIVPGFINAHCHLELSWLHGAVDKHTGLIPFIQKVIQARKSPAQHAAEAMAAADKQMWRNGIVAVADISNGISSKGVKEGSSIYYHTFIELLGLEPHKAKEVFRAGCELYEQFQPLSASIVPHAPYSVSKELFRFISRFCGQNGSLLSIHNQESEEENKFFRYKTGGFVDFYKSANTNIDFFRAQARNSLQTFLPLLPEEQKLLLVHNTYTSFKDIYFIRRTGRDIWFCFCPNANLYIENKLPRIDTFLLNDVCPTLGTDSLASNERLCILSELKTLHAAFPDLNLSETIRWATLNGARFLNIDNKFGSLEEGKKPGLNLISHVNGLQLTPESTVKKLV